MPSCLFRSSVRGDCGLSLGGFGDDNTGHAREPRAFAFAPTGLPEPAVGFLLTVGLPSPAITRNSPDMKATDGRTYALCR